MSKVIGWALVISLVLLLGAHPGTLVDLLHHLWWLLQRAGDELSSFVNML
jgi:hypothetical protein